MIALLHTHVLVVIVFLLLYALKAALLLLNRKNTLAKLRKSTRILDIVFGVLILVTGIWLLLNWNGPMPAYLVVKILLVLVAIPLGIVGLKSDNKLLTILGLLIFAYVYGIAETDSVTLKTQPIPITAPIIPATPETDATEAGDSAEIMAETTQNEIVASIGESALTNAKSIYVQVCANCHGEDGKKQMAGAPDLSVSSLGLENTNYIIEHGSGLMPAFGSQLTEQEIEAVAAYTMTLKTN